MTDILIAICDDQKEVTEELKRKVSTVMKQWKYNWKIQIFYCGEELLRAETKFTVVFLDIELGGIDGIETGKQMKKKQPECKIIIATGKDDRYKEAFYIQAWRFITKPFVDAEINEALSAIVNDTTGENLLEVYCKRIPYQFMQREIMYIPTVLALFQNIPGMEDNNVAGMGSSLDINVAIRRAITEAEQSACYWNEKYDNNDMEEKQEFHPILSFGKSHYRIMRDTITIKESEVGIKFDTEEKELEILLKRLQSSTNQLIVIDITNQELGYATVKTIIPNFEDCLEETFLKKRSIMIKRIIGEYIKNEK